MTDITHKADQCQRLINDPHLKQAFLDVRNVIHQQFEACAPDDGETLIRLRQRLHLLDSVWANLEQAIVDGKLEEFQESQRKVTFLGDKKWLMDQ